MELILIDSGLVNKAGHHYTLAKTVSGALARRKLRYRIFGLSGLDKSIAAEIGVIPHFSRSAYECLEFSWSEKRLRSLAAIFRGAPAGGSPFLSERQTWKALNETFERDLEALPAGVWQKDNLIVVLTLTQNQILGLVRFLRAMPRDRAPRIVCNLMLPPSFLPWGAFGAWGKILPRRLQAGGAADRPLALLYRGQRSYADSVLQGLWRPDAHFADPF